MHPCHVEQRIRSLRDTGHVRLVQPATGYAPPLYRVSVPRMDDVVDFATSRAQISQRCEVESRDSAKSTVRKQAGTGINHLINNKRTLRDSKEKKEKTKIDFKNCTYKGCTLMTEGEYCRKLSRKLECTTATRKGTYPIRTS